VPVEEPSTASEADTRTKYCTKQKDRLAAAFPKIQTGCSQPLSPDTQTGQCKPQG
jgi:hypothetical protein